MRRRAIRMFTRKCEDVGRDSGQSMVEYAIVTALIAIAALGAVEALGGGITSAFQSIVGKLPT